jgi:phage terminase Nu1 subunit (DNA packaging protein)
VRAYCEHTRAAASRRAADPDLAAAKLALTRENAAKVELQNARARGDLLDAQTVRAEWLSVAADLRARLLAVPARVAAAVGLDRPAAAALDRELRRAMTDLAEDSSDA